MQQLREVLPDEMSASPSRPRLDGLPAVLTPREAATALRMGIKELRQLIERGELPAARLGPRRVIRIAKAAVVSLLGGAVCPQKELTPPPMPVVTGPALRADRSRVRSKVRLDRARINGCRGEGAP
jgi:excisionase family DNA binding protein